MSTSHLRYVGSVPEEITRLELMAAVSGIASPDQATRERAYQDMMRAVKHLLPPLQVLPCANAQPELPAACDAPGNMACSGCKLVSYCSKDCQKKHWKVHKQDCKNPLKEEDWLPSWVREGRLPIFVGDKSPEEILRCQSTGKFDRRLALWGKVPAMDVINLKANEDDATKNLNVAFVASGDIRHVVKTFNSLPSDFSGNLTVSLNDITLPVACRNLLLLLTLGMTPDEALAADVALHFWYSVFLPEAYTLQIGLCIAAALDADRGNSTGIALGGRSTLSWLYPLEANSYLMRLLPDAEGDQTPLSASDAQKEYCRFTGEPSRRDFRDRIYARLKPSHRVALQEYRRFGIVLPFGAPNFHFNTANVSLFSPKGQWLQSDFANPLDGWDVDDVIAAGKAHGAHPEDIYGCLYFYLSDQLRMFAHRLRTFSISFKLYSTEACALAEGIKSRESVKIGLTPTMRFDRIAVSNILDSQYVGMEATLFFWGPLLSKSRSATIVGYFLNWFVSQEDGRPRTEELFKYCSNRVMDRDWKIKKLRSKQPPGYLHTLLQQLQVLAFTVQACDTVYDNSKPFSTYLKNNGLSRILKQTKLRLKDDNTIVPRRLKVPLQSPPDALPEFTDESWYNCTNLNQYTWAERFVEFCRD